MIRLISHTEVQTALDCWASHAFKYTGSMTGGDALKPKRSATLLRDGKAWGAAVASYHQTGWGHAALIASLQADADDQRERGFYDEAEFAGTVSRLTRTYDHYTEHAVRLPLLEVERELVVAIPSRRGNRSSTRYRLQCFLDGVHRDDEGRYWIVEFKLRGRLSSEQAIALSRQTRWYAWAWEKTTGNAPAGVIVDERLNEAPSAVRLNQNGRPSKVQSCTPAAYEFACQHAGSEPDAEVLAGLHGKVWQTRTPIHFRGGEMDEAGWQLTSAANVIRQLDTGLLYPIRNPSPARCPKCQFKDICPYPEDTALVDSLFTRAVPKNQRYLEDLEAA